jgi:hypothetical protein
MCDCVGVCVCLCVCACVHQTLQQNGPGIIAKANRQPKVLQFNYKSSLQRVGRTPIYLLFTSLLDR